MKKYFLPIVILTAIILTSCDGQDKAFRTAQKDLLENKILDTFTETINYIPKSYNEIITDTLLSNGLHIKVKHFTNMEKNLVISNKKDSTTNYYREFDAHIEVFKNNQILFKQTINKNFLLANSKLIDKNILDNKLLKNIEIHQESTLIKNNASLILYFCNANEINCLPFLLTINPNGKCYLQQITDANNIPMGC